MQCNRVREDVENPAMRRAPSHGLVALYGKQMSYGAWYSMIGDMMNNGASVPPEDRDAIAGYLAANFGPPEGPAAAK